ncbi:MAG: hypothetical protein V1652_02365 [bacterium]
MKDEIEKTGYHNILFFRLSESNVCYTNKKYIMGYSWIHKNKIGFFLICFVSGILLCSHCVFAKTGGEKIIFLHHSTGGNVYTGGKVKNWIDTYNQQNGTSYQIIERAYPNSPYPWNNYPYDYWNLWINSACNKTNPAIACLDTLTAEYDVIIFKHCFPGSVILEDSGNPSISSSRKSLENYKLQYRALRDLMDSYPHNTFIIWTLVPLHRLATNAENAARAKQFVDWVKNDFLQEDGEKHSNIHIFDFWGLTAGTDNYLKYDYEKSHTNNDSHPNNRANQYSGPIFAQAIVDVQKIDSIADISDTDTPFEQSPVLDNKSNSNEVEHIETQAEGQDLGNKLVDSKENIATSVETNINIPLLSVGTLIGLFIIFVIAKVFIF